mgnify:FL=1
MYNITNNIDTKAFDDLNHSINDIKNTIGNLTYTIHNISNVLSKYNPSNITVPYNFIIIGFFVYIIIFIFCYSRNCIYKKCSKKVYPSNPNN